MYGHHFFINIVLKVCCERAGVILENNLQYHAYISYYHYIYSLLTTLLKI